MVENKKEKRKITFYVDRKVMVWKRDYFFLELKDGDNYDDLKKEIIDCYLEDPIYFGDDPGSAWEWYAQDFISDEVVMGYDDENEECSSELYVRDLEEDDDEEYGDPQLAASNKPLRVLRDEKINEVLKK